MIRKLLVGIVGKPSVGKSTFFSAITLVPVPISAVPFTTIKPNIGVGYLRTPCVCKEFDVEDQPANSICLDGIRLIPIKLIDCAGLVPGAWKGRGLGNKFLDEVRKADALIHIVDAAGTTGEEGQPCKPGENDPLKDVEFLDYEIAMWLSQIISKDWKKITQKSETGKSGVINLLTDRLSGLAIKKRHINKAVKNSNLDPDSPLKWSEEDIFSFAKELRKIAKPMLIAANKIDILQAEKNLERLKETDYPIVPCSTEAELALRRAAEKKLIDYKPGDCNFNVLRQDLSDEQKKALEIIKEKILRKWGTTGVQEALNTVYFKLLQMIAVYPVEDIEKLSDHDGRVLPDVHLVPYGTTAREFAYLIHTDLGKGFIYATDVRTKRRLGEDYILKDRDVIKVYSAKGRG